MEEGAKIAALDLFRLVANKYNNSNNAIDKCKIAAWLFEFPKEYLVSIFEDIDLEEPLHRAISGTWKDRYYLLTSLISAV